MHRVDPRNLSDLMVRDRVHSMNTLQPWLYLRPETGSQLNHAVRFRAHFSSRNEHIRAIWYPRLGTDQCSVKAFL